MASPTTGEALEPRPRCNIDSFNGAIWEEFLEVVLQLLVWTSAICPPVDSLKLQKGRFIVNKGIEHTCRCKCAHVDTYISYIYIVYKAYGGCPKFFLLETAILSRKKITLAKLSPYSQKTFAGPYVGLYLGIFVRKQKLDKGNLHVWATIKTHSVAAAHSRVAFCLYRWSLLTFSAQFWHSHTETKGSPASCLSGNKT